MKTLLTIFLFLLLCFVNPASAYVRSNAVSLSGEWSFCKTRPLNDLVKDRNGKFDPPKYFPQLNEVIPQTIQADIAKRLPENANWISVKVPSAWEQYAGIDFNGAGWFRRSVAISPKWLENNQRIWLEFDAVATAAGVWLNGKWLGGHVGDYSRWRVEATGAAHAGNNELIVYVDELPGHLHQGFLSVIAPHHGGIWQNVRLYPTAAVCVKPDGISVKTDPLNGKVEIEIELDGSWKLSSLLPGLKIGKYNPASPFKIPPQIKAKEAEYNFHFDSKRNAWRVQFQLPDFETWSPENPVLYNVEVNIPGQSRSGKKISEKIYQTFAFREIKIVGSKVLLNGKKLNVRSVLNWGYYPRIVSPAPPVEVVREEFAYYKSLGFNAETICLVVMPDYFYDLADQMGMLIWQEYPTWHDEFTDAEMPTHRQQYPAYFRRDRQHPGIILRSMSVEAGIKSQTNMTEIVNIARVMTDTPVQDNNSWFWLSNQELTQWYGEDNYWNNNRWAKHMLVDLPRKLGEMPEKPYLIGESMAGSVWPDVDALLTVKPDIPLAGRLLGTDQAKTGKQHPYWFPLCFEDCQQINRRLRRHYNPSLPAGEDIVNDYLLPQSRQYSLGQRKFQIQLLYADPRYAGWTFFLGRDVPQCHSGLYDELSRPRWTEKEMGWLKTGPVPPVTTEAVALRTNTGSILNIAPELQLWNPGWGLRTNREIGFYYLQGGYSRLDSLLTGWSQAVGVSEEKITTLPENSVLLTNVLTSAMVYFLQGGGRVFLLSSRWPGALTSEAHMFWADAVFVPPVGPLGKSDREKLLRLQMFDLTHDKTEAIPVARLGIDTVVDPMLRLFQIHDRRKVGVFDQLFATRVGKGLLVASSLSHSATAGQWLLSQLLEWAVSWKPGQSDFPTTRMSLEKLKKLTVARTNQILMLNKDWHFQLDPDQQGEANGWASIRFNDVKWPLIQAARIWEGQGYSYDGMAWYRKWVQIPAGFRGRKVRLVAEGVDDAYRLWINGEPVAVYGSFTDHDKTVFMIQTETDLTNHLKYGGKNLFVLQVVDLFGGGGINRPIYLRIE